MAIPTITTGISAGPIFSGQQTAHTQQSMRRPPMATPSNAPWAIQSPQAIAGLGGQFGDLMRQGGNNLATMFRRYEAPINAQHDLNSQNSRAQAGNRWADLYANQYGTELGTQAAANAQLTSFLANMMRNFM